MKRISHRMAKVKGIDMHIAEKGQGPVVLLLHGFPESFGTPGAIRFVTT
jgi:pimeloyl-ACP methyl ester carboxylesterase